MRTKTIADSIKVALPGYGTLTIIEYQPGNGTRYLLHITDLRDLANAPEHARDYIGGACYTVALYTEGRGTCLKLSATGGYLAPDYVAQKLKVGMGDATVLAEIIALYTGRTAPPADVEEVLKLVVTRVGDNGFRVTLCEDESPKVVADRIQVVCIGHNIPILTLNLAGDDEGQYYDVEFLESQDEDSVEGIVMDLERGTLTRPKP